MKKVLFILLILFPVFSFGQEKCDSITVASLCGLKDRIEMTICPCDKCYTDDIYEIYYRVNESSQYVTYRYEKDTSFLLLEKSICKPLIIDCVVKIDSILPTFRRL